MTLLEIVQDILVVINGNPVNDINDSVEAQDVAQIVKTTYNNMIDGKHYPHLYELFKLEGVSVVAKPNYLKIPETIVDVEWIKYNIRNVSDTKDRFTEVKYKTPQEFINYVDIRNSSATNITVVADFSGISLNIINDKAPQFYTSFDDEYVIFDSWDSAVDTTAKSSKTSCRGRRNPVFSMTSSFVPDLPVQMFSYLLAESKSNCISILKQTLNPKVEQAAKTQRYNMSQDAWKLQKGITYPNYGRK